MGKCEKAGNMQKFMAMLASKRDSVINAAMREFSYGYKKASTDAIVREAGISKGLLFHYFGSKENLYRFLVGYAIEIVEAEYFDMIKQGQKDILESIWQAALLKRDISDKYPSIYDFLFGVQAHMKDSPDIEEISTIFTEKNKSLMQEVYDNCDITLFRDDINPEKAVDLIFWAMEGAFDKHEHKLLSEHDTDGQGYERFLKELRGYIDIFRLCFYR